MSFERSEESFIPLITADEVPGLIGDLYGLSVEGVRELHGYSDKNFYVKVRNKDTVNNFSEFVLKITNLEDSRNVAWVDGQTAMMRHLGAKGVACCQPTANVNGNFMHLVSMEKYIEGIRQYGTYIVRLISYVKGTIMSSLVFESTLLRRVGVFLAEIQHHLEDFTHEYFKEMDNYEWNLIKVVDLMPLKLCVLDDQKRRLSQSVIEAFKSEVIPKYSQLKQGVIHGDFHPTNIVVNLEKSTPSLGVIDFGDSIRSYILFDIAISLAHVMVHDIENSFKIASEVIGGYMSVKPLPAWKLRLLRICIQARLVQVLVLCYNRYVESPCNADYVLHVERFGGWKLVEKLETVSDNEWMRYFGEE